MKAEETLQRILNCNALATKIQLIEDYARLQIEKDREKVADHNWNDKGRSISLDIPIILD